ncbi:MAG: hypothetical protein AABW84_01295, partial [Nanoarchaeota archaeon]
MQETYAIYLTALGTRFDSNSAALNVRNILQTKLRKKGFFGNIRIRGTELYVTGIPEQEIISVIDTIQKSSANIHHSPFKYTLEKLELSEEELQEKHINGLENLTVAQEREIKSLETKIKDSEQQRVVWTKQQQQYENQIIGLEGKLKLAETKSGAVIRDVQEVKIQYFKLPDKVLEDIMYIFSRTILIQDEILTTLEDKSMEEAIELSKLNPYEFLTKRLNYDIKEDYDLILWLTQQHHYECKNENNCEHIKLIDAYKKEYDALGLFADFSKIDALGLFADFSKINATNPVQDIPYLIYKEDNNGVVCAPMGTSKGWLTKQIRDHVTDTLLDKYGKEKVKSHKEKNTRKFIVEDANPNEIKNYLAESQVGREFYKLGF